MSETQWRANRKLQLIEALDGECADCGEQDARTLDLRQPDGRALIEWHTRWELLLERAKECELLCANCYLKRTRTAGRRRAVPPEVKVAIARIPHCHPDRAHHAKGLCLPCYQQRLHGRLPRTKQREAGVPRLYDQMPSSEPAMSPAEYLD